MEAVGSEFPQNMGEDAAAAASWTIKPRDLVRLKMHPGDQVLIGKIMDPPVAEGTGMYRVKLVGHPDDGQEDHTCAAEDLEVCCIARSCTTIYHQLPLFTATYHHYHHHRDQASPLVPQSPALVILPLPLAAASRPPRTVTTFNHYSSPTTHHTPHTARHPPLKTHHSPSMQLVNLDPKEKRNIAHNQRRRFKRAQKRLANKEAAEDSKVNHRRQRQQHRQRQRQRQRHYHCRSQPSRAPHQPTSAHTSPHQPPTRSPHHHFEGHAFQTDMGVCVWVWTGTR